MAARYQLISIGVFVLAATLFSCTNNQPKVVTNQITYLGKVNSVNKNIDEFLGIPYAKAPINQLRWRTPQPFQHKASSYQSTRFKPACYQDNYNINWYKRVASYFDHDLQMNMPEVSEDCLYLNIWKPNKGSVENLPVMVWIHGGSNKSGWSYEPNYLGHNLADKGNVIVVSIAYRLGVFGFMAHSDLSKQVAQTNFGLLDQIQALNWIQTNIEYFGGNKNNITLFGESAGAANIGYLMASPLAKGLFHQAISQSGGFQLLADSNIAKGIEFGKAISTFTKSKNMSELRSLSSEIIWEASKKVDPNYDYRALEDGYFMLEDYLSAFESNADINLLIGNNQHEYYMYQSNDITQLSINEPFYSSSDVNKLIERATQIKELKSAQDWLDTFINMSCPSLKMAQMVTKNNKSVWLYRFDKIRSGGNAIKAYHGGEIPYIFNTHDTWLPTNENDIKLTDYMLKAWSNFAKTGNPNGEKKLSTPIWESFTHQPQQFLRLGDKIETIPNNQYQLCLNIWPE